MNSTPLNLRLHPSVPEHVLRVRDNELNSRGDPTCRGRVLWSVFLIQYKCRRGYRLSPPLPVDTTSYIPGSDDDLVGDHVYNNNCTGGVAAWTRSSRTLHRSKGGRRVFIKIGTHHF